MIRLAFYIRESYEVDHVQALASDLRSYPGLWWKRIKLQSLRRKRKSEYSPRTCSIGRPAGGHSVSPASNFTYGVVGRTLGVLL